MWPPPNVTPKHDALSGRSPSFMASESTRSYEIQWLQMLDEMDDETLINNVEELIRNARTLEIENIAFHDYLLRCDPGVIEGMQAFMETVNHITAKQSFTRRASRRLSMSMSKSRSSFASSKTSFSVSVASTPLALSSRLTAKQKSEIINKEMEILQNNMAEFTAKYKKRNRHLMSILEEMEMRQENIESSMNTFNQTFFPENPQTEIQNEPLKMMIFMEDWYKRARKTIDKLRLRTSSLKVQYFKLCNQLTQKQLQGKDLQEVDFEYLHIDNKHLTIDIEKKLKLLIELKKMNAKGNSTLSRQKALLVKKLKELADKKEQLKIKEDKLVECDEECDKMMTELENAKSAYAKASSRLQIYEPPDVLQYLRNKADVGVLKKNIKVWKRRKQIKDLSLNLCLKQIKSHTSSLLNMNESSFQFQFQNGDNHLEF